MDSNQRKAETLGMNASTANSRLRRNIIHHLLMVHGDHVCHVCKGPIYSADDLSIEHIVPWEGRENGRELFWDLKNIAFSHKWCNKPHHQAGGIGRRITSPEGQAYCTECKQQKPVTEFRNNRKNWNGYARSCRSCNNKHKKKWAELHKE